MRKSGGIFPPFSKILQTGRNAPFLAELNLYCTSQPQVSEVAVEALCNSSGGGVSHFLPSFFDPCLCLAEFKEDKHWKWEPGPRRLLTSS